MKRGEHPASPGAGKVREHHRKHRQRKDQAKEGVDPLEVEVLLSELKPPGEQGRPEKSPEHHHHDGEHRVACQGRVVPVQHQGGNHHHLNAGHGQGQDDRAERLFENLGKVIGMPHDCKRRRKHHGEEPEEEHPSQADAGIGFEPVRALDQKCGRGAVAGQKNPLLPEQSGHRSLVMVGRIAHRDFNGASGSR